MVRMKWVVAGLSLLGCGAEPLSQEELGEVSEAVVVERTCDGASTQAPASTWSQVTLSAVADATIRSLNPNQNLGAASKCPVVGAGGAERSECLIRFQLPTLSAGERVLAAKLVFSSSDVGAQQYRVHSLRRSWTEPAATWIKATSTQSWSKAGAKASADRTWESGCTFTGTTGRSSYRLNDLAVSELHAATHGAPHAGFLVETTGGGNMSIDTREAGLANAPTLVLWYAKSKELELPATAMTMISTGPGLPLGTCDVASGLQFGQRRCLLRWDLSAIPSSSSVQSAQLVGVQDIPWAVHQERSYEVLSARRPWKEAEATWTRYDNSHNWKEEGAASPEDASPLLATIHFDNSGLEISPELAPSDRITGAARRWFENPGTNNGVLIAVPANETAGPLDMSDAQLRLKVTYY